MRHNDLTADNILETLLNGVNWDGRYESIPPMLALINALPTVEGTTMEPSRKRQWLRAVQNILNYAFPDTPARGWHDQEFEDELRENRPDLFEKSKSGQTKEIGNGIRLAVFAREVLLQKGPMRPKEIKDVLVSMGIVQDGAAVNASGRIESAMRYYSDDFEHMDDGRWRATRKSLD